tara:strand:+ start:2140 stop:2796 length:657 start_codon:yes stop_codon:yes gene_type:complete
MDNSSEEKYIESGELRYKNNQFIEAIEDFTNAIEIQPDNSYLYFKRGLCRIRSNNREGGRSDLFIASSLGYEKAEQALQESFYPRSQNFIDMENSILRSNSKDISSYKRRASIKSLIDPLGAISDYSSILDIDSTNLESYINRGIIKRKIGKNKEALTDLNKAIDLNPKNIFALGERGIIKKELNDFQGALDDFKHCLEVLPKDIVEDNYQVFISSFI